jgi:AraC-like DNA-binding protein
MGAGLLFRTRPKLGGIYSVLYKEIASPTDLSSIVECFWLLEHDYRSPPHTHEHLWAHGHSELIFSFGRRYYQKTETGKKFLPRDFVIGPFKNKLMLFSDGFTGLVAVRFKAWGLWPFSIKPVPALVGQITPAKDVFGNKISGLIREMQGYESEEKIEMARQYLQKEFSETDRATIASAPIGERIIAQNGIVSMSDLAKQFGVNSRQLERVFRTETGLSAKMFSRIIRFNQAKRMIENDVEISLSRLTYEMGYSDQAHFSRNFRELFDYSPADFKRRLKRFAREASGQFDVEFLQDR